MAATPDRYSPSSPCSGMVQSFSFVLAALLALQLCAWAPVAVADHAGHDHAAHTTTPAAADDGTHCLRSNLPWCLGVVDFNGGLYAAPPRNRPNSCSLTLVPKAIRVGAGPAKYILVPVANFCLDRLCCGVLHGIGPLHSHLLTTSCFAHFPAPR